MPSFFAIPDTDIDANSPLKQVLTMRQMRDNWEAVAIGDLTVPNAQRVGIAAGYLENQPAGYLRPDGGAFLNRFIVVAPVEVSDIYVFDESVIAWPIPKGVRQMLIEVWGAGSGGGFGFYGACGAYAMKLVDVVGPTLNIVVGLGGAAPSSPGQPSSVSYGTTFIQSDGGVWQTITNAIGGDVNIQGGGTMPVRGGGADLITNEGLMGGVPSGGGYFNGGNGRVTIKVIG